ncbi:hypothetical protein [Streptomyces galbus]|uniref:Bacterial Ig domain-containing protein n=1 Tax=Streptomyces galbus TaxID=33898 RepID=A0A4U5WXK1_STRGB|nr:hypothetical protein [Streptomyces galbus]TKT07308.1 hypothetical protein E4U92_21450 [Streptomyces galbus]GHD36388.1 hypothetical protein GCM10010335_32420 [Streptomyces galbus]
MAIGQTKRSASRTTWTACAVLVVAAAVAPQVVTPAQPAAAADGGCTYSVPTYVWEPATTANIAAKRVLRKYMEWGPKSSDAVLLDTLNTASLPIGSKVFTGGGDGILYEATAGGQVKAYRDNTATGGDLLTPVKTYSLNWSSAKRILTNGQYFLVFASDGTVDIYKQSSPATGDGTLTRVINRTTSSISTAISAADDAWMVNSTVQWLKDGTVQQSTLLPIDVTTSTTVRLWGTTEVATGVDAAQAWAPGPGAVSTQSVTGDPDTTGQVRSYTTGPWTQVDDDVRAGIVGDVMADAGPCLTDPDPSAAPYFGTPPDETGDPVAGDPAGDTIAAPSRTVTGTFTLGNGQPAPGLPVTVTAPDVGIDAPGETKQTVVGTTTTGPDGSWSLTLPETLPGAVQQAKEDNGGVLNLEAVTMGSTTSGTKMLAVDTLSAITDQAAVDTSIAGPDNGHSVKLIPNTVDAASDLKDSFAAGTEAQTYAAKTENSPAVAGGDDPQWQSDTATLPADYDPYDVNGKNVAAEAVRPPTTPMDSGTCDTIRTPISSKIKYTVVGEAHAGWDAKATFEYESSMNTSVETAVKSNGNWTLGGSKEISHSVSISVGYTNKGPYYAKQYRVPIEYVKVKNQHICSGSVRSTWYKIEAKRYKAPAGGALGKVGKDVSGMDGSANFTRSKKEFRNYVEPGGNAQLSKGKSIKFGGAVSFYGVSMGAKTGYDSNHKQKITAGNRPGKHWVWGKNGTISSGRAGVFYSK